VEFVDEDGDSMIAGEIDRKNAWHSDNAEPDDLDVTGLPRSIDPWLMRVLGPTLWAGKPDQITQIRATVRPPAASPQPSTIARSKVGLYAAIPRGCAKRVGHWPVPEIATPERDL
jgi:hypothetical protein